MAQNWEQIGRDLAQKYNNTYIRLKWDGEWEVVYVREVLPGKPPVLVLYNSKFGELQLNYNTNFELSFEFPQLGYFFHDKTACIIVRGYNRQYRRGICEQTARLSSPYYKLGIYNSPELSEQSLISSFKKRDVLALDDAAHKIQENDSLSIPLTNELAVGLHPTKDSFLLWYLNIPVAEYFPEIKVIHLREKVFAQELTDYFNEVRVYNVEIV